MAATCTSIILFIIFIGSIGNCFCLCVFIRKRLRASVLTPFFVALLIADSIYFVFRVIKIVYYQQTLFHEFLFLQSCGSSWLIRSYRYFTQFAPQIFVPLAHYEFYIRFSLILMSFLAVQRAYDVCQPSNRFQSQRSSSKSISYLSIVIALVVSYLLELVGLSIFCSRQLSPHLAYQWYTYLRENLPDDTLNFLRFMKTASDNNSEIECLTNDLNNCSQDEMMQIVQRYFDMHQRPIVALIHKIEFATLGTKLARNELHLKYHYHSCPIRLDPDLFLNIYNLLYSRLLAFNRYTIILGNIIIVTPSHLYSTSHLVLGSILPSLITILSNIISLQSIISIRKNINEEYRTSRHRAKETRRVVIIITVECLLAILNSWLIDVVLSVKHCGGSVALADDCPHFLRQSQLFFACSDLLNSMSNIVLYCFAGRRFRMELKCMVREWRQYIRRCIPCYCRIKVEHLYMQTRTCEEQYDIQSSRSGKSFRQMPVRYRPEESLVEIPLKIFS